MHPVPWIHALQSEIDRLERRRLEHMQPGSFNIADLLEGQDFCRVRGLANFWQTQTGGAFTQHIIDMVVGAHIQTGEPLVFMLAGGPRDTAVYISLGEQAATRSLLHGIFPNIDLTPVGELSTAIMRRHFLEQGIISGVPGRIPFIGENAPSITQLAGANMPDQSTLPTDTQHIARLERIIRGMSGAYWLYIVYAHPRQRGEVLRERLETIDKLTEVASLLRQQYQLTEQSSTQLTGIDSKSDTRTVSNEVTNYRAQYLTRLLERQLERFDEALVKGQWTVRVFFGAERPAELQRLASLLAGTLSGKDSRPEPLRVHLRQSSTGAASLEEFITHLSSEEVAMLIQFPREEVPGYAISDFVHFDVDMRPPPVSSSSPMLALGRIQQYGRDTGDAYTMPLNDLAKHAVVVGVTGSGKTTTVMNILERLVEVHKPFLIIEPAKTEYRALRNAFAGKADVRVYTLGNENVAPFRLNPFEFETDDMPGRASVVNHIDFLKAVFNAAFILYAPMPYVLETALHEIYEDKGWDLATGLNGRLPKWEDRHLYPIFPTLTDLYHKIDSVVERLGYDAEAEQNVKGGLKARVGVMRIGSKGLMLDTARGIPMRQLLSHPTILEMENIGGDDEKTFLMGMILAKLYEYRRLQAIAGAFINGLQHLLVFEEAHRLLKHTETQVDTESSNMRAQAIEVFTNMLSEVRAYGQGVLVAEQIPAKLASDVLKNTNLKIVHRLIARDDRESVGATMNLNVEQTRHLGILTPGQAALFAEGADHAYLVQMHNAKSRLSLLSDDTLKTQSPAYISVGEYLGIRNLKDYSLRLSKFGGPDAALYQGAARVLDSQTSKRIWARLLLCTVLNRPDLPLILDMLRRQIAEEQLFIQLKSQREMALRMLLVRGCFEMLYRRGLTFGWEYPLIEEVRIYLTRGLITLLQTGDLAIASTDLDRFTRKYEQHMQREQGPFPGCEYCRQKCRYRLDVRDCLTSNEIEWIDEDLSDSSLSTADKYDAIAGTAAGIAEQWLGVDKDTNDVGYCIALHAAAALDLTDFEQSRFGTLLSLEMLT